MVRLQENKWQIYKTNLFIIQSIWTNIRIENNLRHLIPHKMDLRLFKALNFC